MKKILLVMSLVVALFLSGCGKENNANKSGDVINNLGNQTQESGKELIDDNSQIDSDVEKYKLSDNYYISGERLYMDECLLKFEQYYEDKNVTYKDKGKIESDGIDINITYKLLEPNSGDMMNYDVRINDEKVEYSDSTGAFGDYMLDYMWLIDLDENDQYKEIVIKRVYGLDSKINIYRLTKNGMKLLFDVDNDWDELLKIGDKWIFTQYFCISFGISDGILMGYYIYEDGEFKYVDRFATGEKINDENGEFPKEFQKIKFGVGGESYLGSYKDGNLSCVFNIISRNDNGNYTIKLTEDGKCDDSIVPAGTVLEDVEIMVSW